MKTDCLKADLFLEAEEALRGLLALEHLGRVPIKESDLTTDERKLAYLQKLIDQAGLRARFDQHLLEILARKTERVCYTHMTLEDCAIAALKTASEEFASIPQHKHPKHG